jgi:hypothetical protein
MTDTTAQHPSSMLLDRLSIGALGALEASQTEEHLSNCAPCQQRVAEQLESFERFEGVSDAMFASLQRRLQTQRARTPLRWWMAGATAASLAAAAWLVLPSSVREPYEYGVKGGPSLQVFVRGDGHAAPVRDGARLHPGDQIRFVTQSAGLQYLLIVSRDAAGTVSVYYPFGGERSGAVSPKGAQAIPGSIELDSTLGEENLYAFFSKVPIDVSTVKQRLERNTSQPQAADLGADALITLRFEKVSAR